LQQILLISPPLSYPLPLLSLTVHLGLLATRLPRLKSEGDEDPLFDDDWAASTFLFPQKTSKFGARPPISLLVMGIGENIIFDPSKEELAVADVALVVSVGQADQQTGQRPQGRMDVEEAGSNGRSLRLLSVRTIDPPSRLTPLGVSNAAMAGLGVSSVPTKQQGLSTAEGEDVDGVWKPPRGGVKMQVLAGLLQQVLQQNGTAHEVLDALDSVVLA
jgi:exosome complex component RRP42